MAASQGFLNSLVVANKPLLVLLSKCRLKCGGMLSLHLFRKTPSGQGDIEDPPPGP